MQDSPLFPEGVAISNACTFPKTSEPRDAVCRSTCPAAVRAVRSVSKFMHRHIRIAYKDHLVIARDIPQHPVGLQRLLGIDRWIPVKSFLEAVVEIVDLQIRECVGLIPVTGKAGCRAVRKDT